MRCPEVPRRSDESQDNSGNRLFTLNRADGPRGSMYRDHLSESKGVNQRAKAEERKIPVDIKLSHRDSGDRWEKKHGYIVVCKPGKTKLFSGELQTGGVFVEHRGRGTTGE